MTRSRLIGIALLSLSLTSLGSHGTAKAGSGLYVGSNIGLTADYGFAFYSPMTVRVCGMPSRYPFLPPAGITLSFRKLDCPHQPEDVDGAVFVSFIKPLTAPVDLKALALEHCDGQPVRPIRFGYRNYEAYRCTLPVPEGMLSRTILYTGFPSAIEYTQIEIVIEQPRPARDDQQTAARFDEIMKNFMLINRVLIDAYPHNLDSNLDAPDTAEWLREMDEQQ